jgi:hypothetical protein
MLKSMVKVMVVPTDLYHVPSKSMYLPLKMGNPSGRSSSGTLEFTKSKRRTVLIHSNKNSLGTVDFFSVVLLTNL